MPAVIHQLVEFQVIAGRFHSATVCGFAPSGNPHLIVATNGTTWPDIGDGNGTDPAGRCFKLYEDVVEGTEPGQWREVVIAPQVATSSNVGSASKR